MLPSTIWNIDQKTALQTPGFLRALLVDGDYYENIEIILDGIDSTMANKAIPYLIKTIESKKGFSQKSAAKALGKIGKYSDTSVSALIKALDTNDKYFCNDVIRAIVKLALLQNLPLQSYLKYFAKTRI